ncbi:MAG TPA: hypothetical protein VLT62_18310 [Candidatus Methylomirabilis sp.]|nr:hypothetical protein [Candidatus Methylomirabilis sp.]
MGGDEMASGYLIVTRFEALYDAGLRSGRYDRNPKTTAPIYGIPHKSRPLPPEGVPRYRGIDRQPLQALTCDQARLFTEAGTPSEANPAAVVLDAVECLTGREDGWVSSLEDITRVWNALAAEQDRYEVIFGRELQDSMEPPPGAQLLGSDAAYFHCDHFSCICDALFFPRWHGTDPDGTLFREYFARLNPNGLFETNQGALEYLRYYLSFDWTERDDDFTSIEVYALPMAGA